MVLRCTGWLVLFSCGSLLGCGDGAKVPGQPPPVTVVTSTLQASTWQDRIEALGTANANESVTITAKVSETVQKVAFDSGDFVEAGQVLVDLTGQVQLAGLEEARAAYRDAEQQLKRTEELVARQLVSGSQVDSQRAARDAARARMDQVRAQLSDRVITAPFDGVLGLRHVSPGSLVTPGTAIATLDDVSQIKLDFSVPETALAALAEGQEITATSAAWPETVFRGVVRGIDSRVDTVTRSVQVRALVPNADGRLRPGMLLRVSVARAPRTTLAVPELAVVQVGRNAFLFRVGENDVVSQVPVQLGARERGRVEVLSGVAAGDRIVVEGTGKLRVGARIVEASAPGAPAP